MAKEGKQKRKIYFTVSEPGELKFRQVSAGKFTKKVRKHKAVRNLQTINTEPLGKVVYDA
jgi:hypothetical protein